MSKIDNLSESIASYIIENKVLSKEDIKLQIKVLLKTVFDVKSVEYSRTFKPTTLDFVSSVASKNKFKSNFWLNKVKENCPEKMKSFYDELKVAMEEQDFSSKREKKAKQLGMYKNE